MGYYVTIRDADFVIPAENEDAALKALKELNKRDELKTGGSWSGGRQTQKWFSWMPADYDKQVSSVSDVFDLLGFDLHVDEKGTHLTGYENKTGAEDHFLSAVAPFVRSGSFIRWVGEDGEQFEHRVENGELRTRTGRVVFD